MTDSDEIADLDEIKHGISIRGKEYGFVGISNKEIDERVNELITFVEEFGGSAGGTFGEEFEACIDFPYETLTTEKFIEFEKKFRETYPTFDGHLYLHDLNHFTSDESKILDSFNYEDLEEDDSEGEDWKNN